MGKRERVKPRLLDLFCGAGGAAMGYSRAGFDVVGVDNRPQPNYPFEFVQDDALYVGVHRPRLFESNVLILIPKTAQTDAPIGVYGTKPDGRTTYRYRNNGNYKGKSLIRTAKSLEEASVAMGIDWMTWDELREAIPPAYTELIGHQLMQHIKATSGVA